MFALGSHLHSSKSWLPQLWLIIEFVMPLLFETGLVVSFLSNLFVDQTVHISEIQSRVLCTRGEDYSFCNKCFGGGSSSGLADSARGSHSANVSRTKSNDFMPSPQGPFQAFHLENSSQEPVPSLHDDCTFIFRNFLLWGTIPSHLQKQARWIWELWLQSCDFSYCLLSSRLIIH